MNQELILYPDGKLKWEAIEEKKLSPSQVRLHTKYAAAKHGTEMAFIKGYFYERGPWDDELKLHQKMEPAGVDNNGHVFHVGNMFVAEVVEVGTEVTMLKVGDPVYGHGSFKHEHVMEEAHCRLLPNWLSWQSAMCLDPAEFAFGAVRDGNVRIGDNVAVFGLGAIGLMVIQILKHSGVESIVAVDPLENRRNLATELGATHTINPQACDAGESIKRLTGNLGVDVAIDFSGNQHALQDALRSIAFGGNVVAGSFPPPYGPGLDLGAEAHMNRPNLIFSRACSDPNRDYPRWSNKRIIDTCMDWFKKGLLSGEKIVSPIIDVGELDKEYMKIATDPQLNIKLGARF